MIEGLTQFASILKCCPEPSSSTETCMSPLKRSSLHAAAGIKMGDEKWTQMVDCIQVVFFLPWNYNMINMLTLCYIHVWLWGKYKKNCHALLSDWFFCHLHLFCAICFFWYSARFAKINSGSQLKTVYHGDNHNASDFACWQGLQDSAKKSYSVVRGLEKKQLFIW